MDERWSLHIDIRYRSDCACGLVGATHMRVGNVLIRTLIDKVDGRQCPLTVDVVWTQCVLIFSLDGFVKVHHRRKCNWDWLQEIGVFACRH